MNPVEAPNESPPARASAGQMLRAAREAQGLHLAMLAVKLKVSVRQLEALEADQHDALKGAAFVRALAQSVCRQLGIDPAPVLAALPQTALHAQIEPLAIEARRSNALRPQARSGEGKGLSRQVLVLAVLMLLGVAALIWWPGSDGSDAEEAQDPSQVAVPMGQASNPQEVPEQAASAELPASAPVPASVPASEPPAAKAPVPAPVSVAPTAQAVASAAVAVRAPTPAASVPVVAPSAASSAATSAAPLVIRLQATAWIEVRDSKGQMLVKRMVKAGETLQLSPTVPFFVYVGKADSAELSWQGKPVDLKPHTQNNEARLQIKP